ncbi:putative bifunctional diguanylate cyclase/phosphodiesterase [Rhodalgimonas zhirmunskyi]|uniref:GGDEF domain-containing phosphodiesterase n=1 Tax=Rhodalgimonas zhirmunskyi TaxID=2964767 RepID=A0AAJ1UA40_9RHOB|nr:GGDEF domain-containing phosphodiesterase [Rhodoalgimonas zhirmunskyi]MDQ2095600.1 GGDEF domain-containing phosphodiesterase [Rhodoalgimonas zhirmunskyi]
MAQRRMLTLAIVRAILRRMMSGPQVLALLPALVLAAYWAGGEAALFIVALGVPLLVLIAGGFENRPGADGPPRDTITGLPPAEALETALEDALVACKAKGLKTACLLVQIEEFEGVTRRNGARASEVLLECSAGRLRSALREGDQLTYLGDAVFGISLRAVPQLDLEAGIQLAARLQSATEEPVSLDGAAVYVSAAVGFCLSARSSVKSGRGLIERAGIALDEARRNGPSAIRAYSHEMGKIRQSHDSLVDEVSLALENGQIRPWFQPQISTDTGRVTGFEALARWVHPERGVVPPGEFLPALEQAGLMERLGEVILRAALQAVNGWDAAGAEVPCVAVNFTGVELRNPRLADKIRWELDRYDLSADRLTIEVLETVVVGAPEDTATRNITRLSEMGCRIDLDDFGTGNASIAAIRRFAIERIKIDRSFITHVDEDVEQQRMVAAILTMAERLGLETLAEGVETAGEHAMLAQLGCRHVQGFGIARPMPFEQTAAWVQSHTAKLASPPQVGRSQSG